MLLTDSLSLLFEQLASSKQIEKFKVVAFIDCSNSITILYALGTYGHLTAAHLQPLHHVFQRVLRTIRPDRHGLVVVGAEEVVVPVGGRDIAAIFAEIEDCFERKIE